MSCDNGGPAYPSSNKLRVGDLVSNGHTGMSLRDYFASKAMQGIVTGLISKGEGTEAEEMDVVSKASYLVADAMLKARQQ